RDRSSLPDGPTETGTGTVSLCVAPRKPTDENRDGDGLHLLLRPAARPPGWADAREAPESLGRRLLPSGLAERAGPVDGGTQGFLLGRRLGAVDPLQPVGRRLDRPLAQQRPLLWR